jgi:carbonic anhydrase
MSEILEEILAANADYRTAFGDKSKLSMPPVRRFAILTCMDARLNPARFAGLAEGEAHFIRNAGGRASDDAIRSLVISYRLLGTQEGFVIHHTDCGMSIYTDETMRQLLAKSLDPAKLGDRGWEDVGSGPGSTEAQYVNWLTFRELDQSVVEDVTRIRNHPLVAGGIPIYGLIYDCGTGQLYDVPNATAAGRAK